MKDCLFCNIANGKVSSDVVYEDNTFLVFMDKYPDSPGHMLIVPKNHILDSLSMDDETFKAMNKVIKNMINLVTEKLGADGVTLTQNNGICQEIKHYHFHIIPAYSNKPNMSNEEVYKKLIEK